VAEVWSSHFLCRHLSVLRSLGARYGFRAEKIDPVRYKDFVVSSTRIRRLVSEGRVDEAGALLGHHYAIEGVVVQGHQRGRGLGFPTANLCAENELLPPRGVYATTAMLGGVAYPSMTNIGTRPTFESGETLAVETHIMGFDQDLYGARLRLGFVQRLRDERKFESVDAWKALIDAYGWMASDLLGRLGL
jgi:riboflavin kinase/FMN adenylyltransferase